MLQLAVLLVLFSPRCLSHQNHNVTRSQRAWTPNTPWTYDRRGGGGGVRAIVTHRGPTTGGGGVRAAHRGPSTGGGGGGGVRAIAAHRGPKGQIRVRLDAAPDRALKKRTGRMAALSVQCAKFAVSMQVATDWCSRGISLLLWRGGRNINNRYSAFEYRYSIVKKKYRDI